MNLFFAYDYPLSGTESVLMAMAEALRAKGHFVTTQTIGKNFDAAALDMSLSSFDVAHFWNKRSFDPFAKAIRIPYGFTSHGFGGSGDVQKYTQSHYIDYFKCANPYWMHTMDTFTLQILGRVGLHSFWTPQCITHEPFYRLPKPKEMTLGCIGADADGFKRHKMIKEAAKQLKIPFIEYDSSYELVDKQGVINLYEQMAIFVNAIFGACGPVPPQEALLCGRPVVSTRIDTMVSVIQEGINGEFFDGSMPDLVKKVEIVFNQYDKYYEGTHKTILLSANEAADRFIAGIENNL